MISLTMLRQQAATIGITEAEAKKYGDLRHKRTWTLAIEHHQQNALSPQQTPSLSPIELNDDIEAIANEYESLPDEIIQTDSTPKALNSPPLSNIKSPAIGKQDLAFEQVVKNHIKALRIGSGLSENQSHSPIKDWLCPECGGQELNCYLCRGVGNIDEIAAIGWTLAYMEMLGCSPTEIAPLRSLSPSPDTLKLSLEVCLTIKKSTEILNRTEKWVHQQLVPSLSHV
ncbi:hypothetical protein PN499_17140 [Kamptonema animale CS-326]|jgi:hypothetical protein|uniref:hypothetical protein n=1 Tax=Kamptonema animale TaxID=92934 RepID=UPI00232E93A6|nr:hypothetical protein [Kamptonema animale]MDB9512918.1 hypothetical protein [Kamptonema animale CS-326]